MQVRIKHGPKGDRSLSSRNELAVSVSELLRKKTQAAHIHRLREFDMTVMPVLRQWMPGSTTRSAKDQEIARTYHLLPVAGKVFWVPDKRALLRDNHYSPHRGSLG